MEPLESRLTRYAATLAENGRGAATAIRLGEVECIGDSEIRLAAAEKHLMQLLLAMDKGWYDDLDGAPLDLARYAPPDAVVGKSWIVAERWARVACRGHSWLMLTAPRAAHHDRLNAAAEEAGIEPERLVWAPGLDNEEARAVCASLGLREPEPLADLDERMTKREQARISRAAAIAIALEDTTELDYDEPEHKRGVTEAKYDALETILNDARVVVNRNESGEFDYLTLASDDEPSPFYITYDGPDDWEFRDRPMGRL